MVIFYQKSENILGLTEYWTAGICGLEQVTAALGLVSFIHKMGVAVPNLNALGGLERLK